MRCVLSSIYIRYFSHAQGTVAFEVQHYVSKERLGFLINQRHVFRLAANLEMCRQRVAPSQFFNVSL